MNQQTLMLALFITLPILATGLIAIPVMEEVDATMKSKTYCVKDGAGCANSKKACEEEFDAKCERVKGGGGD